MNIKFDEFTKGLAQSVNRRDALRRFGRFGLVTIGAVLASLGIRSHTQAAQGGGLPSGSACLSNQECASNKCLIRKVRYQGSWVRIGTCE